MLKEIGNNNIVSNTYKSYFSYFTSLHFTSFEVKYPRLVTSLHFTSLQGEVNEVTEANFEARNEVMLS